MTQVAQPATRSIINSLRTLSFSFNRLSVIPSKFSSSLSNLSHLDFESNQLEDVSSLPWSELIHLEWLNLRNNSIRSLPLEIGTLEHLNGLLLDGNPQRTVNQSIIAKGTLAIKEYLKQKISTSF